MTNRLAPIINQKKIEIESLRKIIENDACHPINQVMLGKVRRNSARNFKESIKNKPSVIAEIKRRSPSKGILAAIANPQELACNYIKGKASALSVLTDKRFFGGSLDDLSNIANISSIPILRKDFIIDPIQIAESIIAGADAILAIVKILENKTKLIIDYAAQFSIDVIVEVHNQTELDLALSAGATIIGVNNRNLNTFDINLENSIKLIQQIPNDVIKIAESGIHNSLVARQYYQHGFDAVLIGEALVTSSDPENFIQECLL